MFQRVIMAGSEGGTYQCGHWMFGKASTSRDIIIRILKLLAGKEGYVEMPKSLSAFSVGTLARKKVVFVSEIDNLQVKVGEQLKVMLGRETTSAKYRNDPEINSLNSECQLIFNGNEEPKNCGAFYNIPPVRENIIVLKLDQTLPPKYMLQDNEAYIKTFLPIIWAWAVLSDRSWYLEQIRAKIIINTQVAQGTIEVGVIQLYIEERLARIKDYPTAEQIAIAEKTTDIIYLPSDLDKNKTRRVTRKKIKYENHYFISKLDLVADYESWSIKNGYESKSTLGQRQKNYLPGKIVQEIQTLYGLATLERKKDKLNGYEGIALKPTIYDPKLMTFKGESVTDEEQGILQADISSVVNKPYPFSPRRLEIFRP